MDRDRLQDVLTEARVPEGLQDLVLARGFDCPSDFAFAFPNIADLQPFIVSARDFWTANKIEDPESSVAAAHLRKALAECHRLSLRSEPPEPAAQSNRILGRALATQAHIRTRVKPGRDHAVHPPCEPSARGPEARAVPEVGALAVSPFITAIPGAHGSKVGPSRALRPATPESGLL